MLNLSVLLDDSARRYPDRTAVVLGETRLSYAQVQAAYQRGAKVVLLPTIPYGTETNQREFPLSLNLNPSTLDAVIGEAPRLARPLSKMTFLAIALHHGLEYQAVPPGFKSRVRPSRMTRRRRFGQR